MEGVGFFVSGQRTRSPFWLKTASLMLRRRRSRSSHARCSTQTYTVVNKIPFNDINNAANSNNGAEQCQWSPRTAKFYISIPGIAGHPDGEGGVAVIDPKTMMVVDTFIIRVDDCAVPQGMAVRPDSQILLGRQPFRWAREHRFYQRAERGRTRTCCAEARRKLLRANEGEPNNPSIINNLELLNSSERVIRRD